MPMIIPDGFDPMAGPKVERAGTEGTVFWGRIKIGSLSDWRIVTSPTTGKLTLIGQGSFKRYFVGAEGIQIRAVVTPTQAHYLIGRPKPPKAKPLTLNWNVHTLTTKELVLIAQS